MVREPTFFRFVGSLMFRVLKKERKRSKRRGNSAMYSLGKATAFGGTGAEWSAATETLGYPHSRSPLTNQRSRVFGFRDCM